MLASSFASTAAATAAAPAPIVIACCCYYYYHHHHHHHQQHRHHRRFVSTNVVVVLTCLLMLFVNTASSESSSASTTLLSYGMFVLLSWQWFQAVENLKPEAASKPRHSPESLRQRSNERLASTTFSTWRFCALRLSQAQQKTNGNDEEI